LQHKIARKTIIGLYQDDSCMEFTIVVKWPCLIRTYFKITLVSWEESVYAITSSKDYHTTISEISSQWMECRREVSKFQPYLGFPCTSRPHLASHVPPGLTWLPMYLPASLGLPPSRCYSDYTEITLCDHFGFWLYHVGVPTIDVLKYEEYISIHEIYITQNSKFRIYYGKTEVTIFWIIMWTWDLQYGA
jgi:hypothetical protein